MSLGIHTVPDLGLWFFSTFQWLPYLSPSQYLLESKMSAKIITKLNFNYVIAYQPHEHHSSIRLGAHLQVTNYNLPQEPAQNVQHTLQPQLLVPGKVPPCPSNPPQWYYNQALPQHMRRQISHLYVSHPVGRRSLMRTVEHWVSAWCNWWSYILKTSRLSGFSIHFPLMFRDRKESFINFVTIFLWFC